MQILVDTANYVTKQILKEATENILPRVALGTLCLLIAGLEPVRDMQGDQAREIMCEQGCQERYFSRGPNCARAGFGEQDDFSV